MDQNVLLITISTAVVALVLIFITFMIVKRKRTNRYRQEINELDVEKNKLIGVPILSEISKVKDLVKTDNLKNKLEDWDTTFKLIKEDEVPKLTDMISDAEFLIDKSEYKQAVKKIAYIEMQIATLQKRSTLLLDEIKIITNSEERNRALITKLKINYRELQSKFERTIKDYGPITDNIKKHFEYLDKKFLEFEDAMDLNDYVLVEKIVLSLEEDINKFKKVIDEAPSIVLTATVLLPNKIDEMTTLYFRMLRDGYPLDYLNVEYNIKEIKSKIENIINRLKELDMTDSSIELKTMLDYFNSLYNDFEKEKECKDLFKENSKNLKYKIEKINKVVRDIYLQIDDIKSTYDLSDEAINKFSLLNKNLEQINEDFKLLISHGNGHTFAYSRLVDELDGLSLKLSRLQDDLDYQLRSITSMKDDETRAKEELNSIQDLLKKTKNRLKEYKIPVIPSSYFIELREAQEAIREVIKELDKKPIVIKILNIRVENARDLVFKIYNKTNDMIKSAMLSEKIIIYGNRYRSTYPKVAEELEKSEILFNKGQYKLSFDTSLSVLKEIDNSVEEKFAS